jgi:L-malate glycosyltransferase
MRICFFTPTFYPRFGGVEQFIDKIARDFIRRGHPVMVLAPHERGRPVDVPYEVVRYRMPWKRNWWPELLAYPLWKAHRRFKFDVVVAIYGYPTGYEASLLKRRLGFALVVNPHGSDLYPNFHALGRWRVDRTIAAGYGGADRIISISQWISDRLQTVTEGRLPPVDLIYNGLDLAEHDRQSQAARVNPPSMGVRGPFILHLGRVAPVKRHDLAIEAVHRLKDEFQRRGMSYVIVGDGQAMDDVRQMIERYDLGAIVKLLGTRTGLEKAHLLNSASMMMSTSREEGMPMVIMEGIVSGLPILASDIGPHQELMAIAHNGLLFRSGDVEDLASKLRTMLDTDPAEYQASARRVRHRFDFATMMDGYEATCQRALEMRGLNA